MKHKIVLLALLACLAWSAKSQTGINGKWYTFVRNRVIELTLSADSVISRQLTWELTPMPNKRTEANAIDTIIRANGNLYYCIIVSIDSLRKIVPVTYKVLKPGTQLLSAINTRENYFDDRLRAQQYICIDTGSKTGMTFYSEAELLRLKAQPPIDSITKENFKLFCKRVIVLKAEIKKMGDVTTHSNALLYFGYFAIHDIIGEIGYNPLASDKQFDNMVKHFENDPELKDLIAEMQQ